MELEKYTERSKGFIQSAQNLALRSGHQRLAPEHLLKGLLEDQEGLCATLIRAAGGEAQAIIADVTSIEDMRSAAAAAISRTCYCGNVARRPGIRRGRG